MKYRKIILFIIFNTFLYSCADYQVNKNIKIDQKKYFSSSGFAMIYDDMLYNEKVLNKKINSDEIVVMHNFLKRNTPIKIINPENSKFIDTKIHKTAKYPSIFNAVISKKIALILDLDYDNPFIEILETKKNKIFVAKKSNTFDEERNVAEKAPVDEIKMDDLSLDKNKDSKKILNEKNFVLLINNFYFEDSAINLKNQIIKKAKITNIFVKKINDKKYSLLAGPFKNFNALKNTYISLNNLGFENLDIYKD